MSGGRAASRRAGEMTVAVSVGSINIPGGREGGVKSNGGGIGVRVRVRFIVGVEM